MDDFYKDLEVGKRGEKMVAAALEARGHFVKDLSDDFEARRKDIDIQVFNKQQQTTTIEIKNDVASERTGNVFIETYNDANKSHSFKGWLFYCAAEYICFLQEESHKAHIVKLDELKADIKAHKYRVANTSRTQGYIMPIAALATLPSYFLLAC